MTRILKRVTDAGLRIPDEGLTHGKNSKPSRLLCPACPGLPTELWMDILSWPGHYSKRDLMTCALVNTMFYDIVLPALWSNYTLRFVPYDRSTPSGTYSRADMNVVRTEADDARTLEGFFKLLYSSPAIRRNISTLYLESLDFPSDDANKAAYSFVEPDILLGVLRLLPKLRTLRLTDIAFPGNNCAFTLRPITPKISLSRLSIKFGKNRDYTIDDKDVALAEALLHPFKRIGTLYWVDRLEDNNLFLELPSHVHVESLEVTTRSWMRLMGRPTKLKALHILPSSPYDGPHGRILHYLKLAATTVRKISLSAVMCCMDFPETTALDLLKLCSRVRLLTVYVPLPQDWHRTPYLDFNVVDMCENITGILTHLASENLLPELKHLRWMFQTGELDPTDPLPQDYIPTARVIEEMDAGLQRVALERRELSVSVSLGDSLGRRREPEAWEVPLQDIFPQSRDCNRVRFL